MGLTKEKKYVHDYDEYYAKGKKATVTVSITMTERILTPSANGTIDITVKNNETKPSLNNTSQQDPDRFIGTDLEKIIQQWKQNNNK